MDDVHWSFQTPVLESFMRFNTFQEQWSVWSLPSAPFPQMQWKVVTSPRCSTGWIKVAEVGQSWPAWETVRCSSWSRLVAFSTASTIQGWWLQKWRWNPGPGSGQLPGPLQDSTLQGQDPGHSFTQVPGLCDGLSFKRKAPPPLFFALICSQSLSLSLLTYIFPSLERLSEKGSQSLGRLLLGVLWWYLPLIEQLLYTGQCTKYTFSFNPHDI